MLSTFNETTPTDQVGDITLFDCILSNPDQDLYIARLPDNDLVFVKRSDIAYRYDKNRRRIYQQESDLAKSFEHPNLQSYMKLHEIDGELIHIIHYNRGMFLGRFFELCRERIIELPLKIRLQLVDQILAGFEHLHSRVFNHISTPNLHVALRPDAIFLTESGYCQLLQFSLAPPPTISSSIVRPEHLSYRTYAAPEQCTPGLEPDHRADLFTLGILMFEALTAKLLFYDAGPIDEHLINRRKVRGLHPRLSDVDPGLSQLDDVVAGLLQPVPHNRPGNLSKIRKSIRSLIRISSGTSSTDDVALFIEELLKEPRYSDTDLNDPHRPDLLTNIAEYNRS